MKCLSIRNPWAWAIIHGDPAKDIENRSWQTDYRGPLLIHAGKSSAEFATGQSYDSLMPGLPDIADLHFGAIIGLVNLVDCVPLEQVASSPWAEGPWCWILANPRPMKPVQWTGKLSLFQVDPSQLHLASVLAQGRLF
jgi:hypothetical protein